MNYASRADTVRAFKGRRRRLGSRIRAFMRDTLLLIREFWPLLLGFNISLILAALSFKFLWNQTTSAEPVTVVEAFYIVLTLTFFESAIDFPEAWYLDAYFFVMPLIGLVFIALGVADFAVVLVNRHSRRAEWEAALASTYNNHIIVAGLGRLGIRVLRELVRLNEDIVVIEMRADNPRIEEAHTYDIPVIVGDARTEEVLLRAGLEHAEALILCTNDDLMNLQMASRIRDLNKDVRLVMRMFDDQFARSIADRFDITAVMSSSGLAAPAFAGAATRTEIIQTFSVEDRVLGLGRIELHNGYHVVGQPIEAVESFYDLSIVLVVSNGAVDVHPEPEYVLSDCDVIHVVGELPKIQALASQRKRNRT